MRRYIAILSIALGLFGCNALDEKGTDTGAKLFIPVDERPIQQALTAPPPISGGTLAVTADNAFVVAADPDRDRISIVNLASHEVRHVALEPGDEPGRVALDTHGRAHVALRRGGAVVRVDLASGVLEGRTSVCASPRGLVSDPGRDLVHVACTDGKLVTIDSTGAITRSVKFGTDLRDVMLHGDELLVSTYKGAELLAVDPEGELRQRTHAPKASVSVQRSFDEEPEERSMQPHLAWRTLRAPDGSVFMLHQRASETMVDIDTEPEVDAPSSYGGGGGSIDQRFSCAGIVQSSVTEIGAQGGSRSLTIMGGVLAVDMARSNTGSLAVALPGTPEPDAPRPTVVFDNSGDGPLAESARTAPDSFGFPGTAQIVVYDAGPFSGTLDPAFDQNIGCTPGQMLPVPGQPTAVAFAPDGRLLVQSREPASLTVIGSPNAFGLGQGEQVVIELGGDSVRDTGHDVFHRDAGAGIACASCHGEGGDDGHTWLFSSIGARRTQAVNIGLEGTAPFHWDGKLRNLGVLMEEVFVGRMGGVHQSGERLDTLATWLFAQKPFTPIVEAGDPAAERGKALFESADTGCTGCHNGEMMTDNRSYDVGTGEREGELLQVPSLRGVGYRAPFIHTGCADTLRDRFDPSCGGEKHGSTAHLDDEQIGDLIAYLQSL